MILSYSLALEKELPQQHSITRIGDWWTYACPRDPDQKILNCEENTRSQTEVNPLSRAGNKAAFIIKKVKKIHVRMTETSKPMVSRLYSVSYPP